MKGTQVDGVLLGLLNLLNKIFTTSNDIRDNLNLNSETDLSGLIFNECLFTVGDSLKEIKCKSQESRAAAFKLLLTLCRKHYSSTYSIIESLLQLSDRVPILNKWNYVPLSDMRSSNGYVGIRNLGCICYMNAML